MICPVVRVVSYVEILRRASSMSEHEQDNGPLDGASLLSACREATEGRVHLGHAGVSTMRGDWLRGRRRGPAAGAIVARASYSMT
jgi:hypothetical protein